MHVGANSTLKYGYLNSLKYIESIGGNALQIQLKNTEYKTIIKQEIINEFHNYLKTNDLFLINHSQHKLNFSKNPDQNQKDIDAYIDDMIVIDKLGGHGTIVHMGKKLDMDYQEAIDNMIETLLRIYDKTKHTNSKILIENSAGEGTALYLLEDMAKIYKALPKKVQKKIEFVLDTCHAYTSGYDIATKTGMKDFLSQFNKLIGKNKIACFHLNDSKEPLNSRKDRHESLFLGYIGKNKANGLKYIISYSNKYNIPLILETPNYSLHKSEISFIKLIS